MVTCSERGQLSSYGPINLAVAVAAAAIALLRCWHLLRLQAAADNAEVERIKAQLKTAPTAA